ncbi:MAG: xanthine dehydrogenase family protein molybdopterin-binding subunit [Litoreibacter sp.]
MNKFGTSQPIRRLEDTRLLTGHGHFMDNIAPNDALQAFVFRSNVAHADIIDLDVSDARMAPGVHMVATAESLKAAGVLNAMKAGQIKNRDGSMGAAPERPILATKRVRFVGEPIAVVIAETLAQAKDAAELIVFDYDDLPSSLEVNPNAGPDIHTEAPGNVAYDWGIGDEDATEDAFKAAAYTTQLKVADNRVIVASMEPRGIFAEPEGDRLHVSWGGQGVWGLKGSLARTLGIEPERIRATNPDIGGGFGMKAFDYPEYFVVSHAALNLQRSVKWQADRTESMLSDNAGRDLHSVVELAFDENYKITAYRVDSTSNMGAYNSGFAQFIQSDLASRILTGCYDIQTAWFRNRGIYTNTTQVDAYRGAGRPEAIYVLERAIDAAARTLGINALELRRKNFIPSANFPYDTVVGETYDVGDFARVLERAETEADLAGYETRRDASRTKGKLRGLGVCYYIESILGSPTETARVEFTPDTVNLYVGTQSTGQGHETVYRQLLNEFTGIPLDAITVRQGDSDLIPEGGGTGGSRSVTTQGTAINKTSEVLVDAFKTFIADELGLPGVAFEDGAFRAEGSNVVMTMIEAANAAREKGRDDLMNHSRKTTLPGRSFPNGCHVAELEIDPETGVTEVVKYTVVDDFGNLMNPLLAEGQVHGGVVQGIGQAISEHVVHDEDGQLLTASFMDYGLPRANDVPMIAFHSEPVPSTANVLGMKGCGEAGTVGALAAIANAALDAVWETGVRHVDMPFTPHRVWGWLNDITTE